MTLDTLVALLSYIVLVSATVERVVQFLKSLEFTKLSSAGATTIQSVAVVVGIVLGYFTSSKELVTIVGNQYAALVMTGFLASAGSGVWHDLLVILQNFKSGKA
jgi:hypothetical protein